MLTERIETALDRFINPILQREIRGTFRGIRFLLVLVLFLLVLGTAVLVAAGAVIQRRALVNPAEIGGTIHAVFFSALSLSLLFILPAFAATSLVSEKEKDTSDLLRITSLSEGAIVRGKFLASMAYAIVFLAAALPLGSVSFLFGGVTVSNLAASYLTLLLLAAAVSMSSIFVSSQMKRSRNALSSSMVFSIGFLTIPISILSVDDFRDLAAEVLRILGLDAVFGERMLAASPGLAGTIWWLCIVIAPAYLFAAIMLFSYLSAVNKLKPWSGNRSTSIRIFYAAFLPLGAAIALSVLAEIRYSIAYYRIAEYVIIVYGAIWLFMLLSTYFSTEDPEWNLAPRQDLWNRGMPRLLSALGPGSMRGFRFALSVNLAALCLLLPIANRCMSPIANLPAFHASFREGVSLPLVFLSATVMALVFLFSSAGLLVSLASRIDMARKAALSAVVISVLFVPLASFGLSHSFKEIESSSPADLGFMSPIVAVGSVGSGYWESLKADSMTGGEPAPKAVFPYEMEVFGSRVPVFGGFIAFSAAAGSACIAAYFMFRRRTIRG